VYLTLTAEYIIKEDGQKESCTKNKTEDY